jgi:hypothetical protein
VTTNYRNDPYYIAYEQLETAIENVAAKLAKDNPTASASELEQQILDAVDSLSRHLKGNIRRYVMEVRDETTPD